MANAPRARNAAKPKARPVVPGPTSQIEAAGSHVDIAAPPRVLAVSPTHPDTLHTPLADALFDETLAGGVLAAAGKTLRVRSVSPTARRRAGRAFGPDPIELEADDLDETAVAALLGDPQLLVEIV